MSVSMKMAIDALCVSDGVGSGVGSRVRSDSTSSTASQGSKGRLLLRQRLSQLLTCVEDLSSDDEANEELSRTLDEAFQLCGGISPRDTFRCTHLYKHPERERYTQGYFQACWDSAQDPWS